MIEHVQTYSNMVNLSELVDDVIHDSAALCSALLDEE